MGERKEGENYKTENGGKLEIKKKRKKEEKRKIKRKRGKRSEGKKLGEKGREKESESRDIEERRMFHVFINGYTLRHMSHIISLRI